ncbi:hypothetical protein SGLAM104S_08195 [Streptomyces glaucescens]
MPESGGGGVREVKSAARTVELLELLSARGDRPARLQELADELGVPRSSMYALLQTLISRGWVRTDITGSLYGIGIRALLTGTGYLDSALAGALYLTVPHLGPGHGLPLAAIALTALAVWPVTGRLPGRSPAAPPPGTSGPGFPTCAPASSSPPPCPSGRSPRTPCGASAAGSG